VLADCSASDLGDGVIQLVVPASRVEDARRGGFREIVEDAARDCGYNEVRWRRPK
jgi:hypothetical protein